MRGLILLVLFVLGFAQETPTLQAKLKVKDQQIPPALIQGIAKMRAKMVAAQLDALKQFGGKACGTTHQYAKYLSHPAIALVDFGKGLLKYTPQGLLQKLKPYSATQEKFLKNFKQFEALHLLYLVENSISDPCSPVVKFEATPKQVAQDFLDSVNFIYTPLIQAYQMGLDPIAYMHSLNADALLQLLCPKCHHANTTTDLDIFQRDLNTLISTLSCREPIKAFLGHLKHDSESMVSAIEFWQALREGTIMWANLALRDGHTDELVGSKDDPYTLFSTHYLARTIFLLLHAYEFYIDAKDTDQYTKEFQENPTICLNPRYLSAKHQQACLQVFKTQTYKQADLNDYLKAMRFISIDTIPCMYLDPRDKLQIFKSSNAICVALQKHLVKE
ncbi:hypothetical protein [Helicobacter labacensis]|uniref:hypothetical protein n=1 Tax=Helicobacter labacensis TaxID=2316079 RepID=UPI001F231BF1|nr:hypothetical protein [Helicobacter labacensis]